MMKNRLILLITLFLIGICSAKTFHPLNLEWSYPLKSDSVYPLDLDKDGLNELYVVSYGEHMSCIHFFNYDGNKTTRNCIPEYRNYMYPYARERITLIYVDDLNNDSILDVIAASSIKGTSVHVQKIYGVKREYKAELDQYRYNLKWEYTPENSIMDVKACDLRGSGEEDIIAGSLDFNVYIFRQDGLVEDTYNLGGGVWSVDVSDIDGDGDIEIVAGSFLGVSLIDKGIIRWNHSTKKRVFEVYTEDLDGDGNSEILALSEDEIHLLDGEGRLLWRTSMENLVDSWIGDIDRDGAMDILLLTNDDVYLLNKNGNVQWQYNLSDILLTVSVEDDNNIFIGSQDNLYKFKINPEYFLNEDAERIYSDAYNYYLQEKYPEARFYANKSKQIFSMVDNLEGVLKCDFILLVTTLNTTKVSKRERADGYYTKAVEFLNLKSYEDAIDYAEMALTIYQEIGDKNNVIKCDLFIIDIDRKMEDEKRRQARVYYTTANGFLSNNTFDEASAYALKALQAYEELNDTLGISNSESLIQEIVLKERIYLADYFHSQSIQFFESRDYVNATIYAEKAKEIYIELNDAEKIGELDSLEETLDRYIEVESYFNLAREYYRRLDLENAALYAEKAKEIYIELNDADGVVECDFLLSEIEKMRGENLVKYTLFAAPIVLVILLIAFLHMRRLQRERWIKEKPRDNVKIE